MKLAINKLQQGGLFQIYQPLQFETRNPVTSEVAGSSSSSTTSTASSKKKEEDGTTLLTKQVMNELIKNGLPNEVDHFLTQLHKLENSSLTSELTRSQTIALAKEANRIIHNRKQWSAAIASAKENEALSDYAVTDNGDIYVYDGEKKRIRTISAKEYVESVGDEETLPGLSSNKNIYQPLTVGQLAEYRASLPQTAFEENSISTIRQSIGISKISKSIWSVVTTLGNSSSSQEDYKTVAQMLDENDMNYRVPSSEALEGLKEIAQTYSEMGVNAVFKFTEKNNNPNIQAAMKYLYSMLPKNAINQLKTKALVEGNELYTPQQLITNALGAGIKSEHSLKVDIAEIKDPNKSSSKAKTDNLTTAQMLVSGDLGRIQYNLISTSDPDKSLSFQGNTNGRMVNIRTGVEVEDGIFSEKLNKAEMFQLIDQTNMYAGTQKITYQDLSNFIYEGGDIVRINVPVINGAPDFETALKVNALLDMFKQKPNDFPTDREKTMALYNYGIPGKIENGEYIGGDNTAEYFVITGLTTDKIVDPSDNIYSIKVDKDRDGQLEEYMKQQYALYNKGKKGDQKLDSPIGLITHMVHVPIFFKLHSNAKNTVLTAANSGPQVTVPTLQESMAREQFQTPSYNQQQQIIQGASSSLLFPSSN